MISFVLSQEQFWATQSEGYVLFLKDEFIPASSQATLEHIEKKFYPNLKDILKKHQFEGKAGQVFVLTGNDNGKLVQFIFVGLGKCDRAWHIELESYRRALGSMMNTLKRLVIKTATITLPDAAMFNVASQELVKQSTITMLMADYEFVTFKTEKKKKIWDGSVTLVANSNAKTALEQGVIIGTAINNARHWADLPANILTPTVLSQEAKKIADKHNLPCTIFGRDKALELGMGAFCAVDAGSEQDGKFVVIEYKTTKKDAPTIALCGKGIIFDTGGINLKPTSHISGMKFDMSGAASVIGIMDIIAQLKPDVNVIGLTPLVENMPGGKASRPDDIVTAMNGKTIEIQNTDAEGRLVLSDTLCYAEKFYKPDVMIDIATLTGAVLYALGHFYTAVMSKDEALVKTLFDLGRLTGDKTWELPLDDDFDEAIKTPVADIHNNGNPSYYAGTIVGGTFLKNFVEKARWAHLDIAGTAHDVVGVNYVGKGASGASMRLLTEFIMTYK